MNKALYLPLKSHQHSLDLLSWTAAKTNKVSQHKKLQIKLRDDLRIVSDTINPQ